MGGGRRLRRRSEDGAQLASEAAGEAQIGGGGGIGEAIGGRLGGELPKNLSGGVVAGEDDGRGAGQLREQIVRKEEIEQEAAHHVAANGIGFLKQAGVDVGDPFRVDGDVASGERGFGGEDAVAAEATFEVDGDAGGGARAAIFGRRGFGRFGNGGELEVHIKGRLGHDGDFPPERGGDGCGLGVGGANDESDGFKTGGGERPIQAGEDGVNGVGDGEIFLAGADEDEGEMLFAKLAEGPAELVSEDRQLRRAEGTDGSHAGDGDEDAGVGGAGIGQKKLLAEFAAKDAAAVALGEKEVLLGDVLRVLIAKGGGEDAVEIALGSGGVYAKVVAGGEAIDGARLGGGDSAGEDVLDLGFGEMNANLGAAGRGADDGGRQWGAGGRCGGWDVVEEHEIGGGLFLLGDGVGRGRAAALERSAQVHDEGFLGGFARGFLGGGEATRGIETGGRSGEELGVVLALAGCEQIVHGGEDGGELGQRLVIGIDEIVRHGGQKAERVCHGSVTILREGITGVSAHL